MIDGSPDLVKSLGAIYFPPHFTEEDLQNFLMKALVEVTFPDRISNFVTRLLAEETFEKKFDYFTSTLRETNCHSSEFIKEMFFSLLTRIKIMQDLGDYEELTVLLNKTKLTLVKPIVPTVKSLSDDFGLQAFTSSEIEIHEIEGNHKSILENAEMVKILNDFEF